MNYCEIIKYLLDNLFVAGLNTIAFFIIAAKYDRIQIARSCLVTYEYCLIHPKAFFRINKTTEDFLKEIDLIMRFSRYNNMFGEKLKNELEKSLIFFDQFKENDNPFTKQDIMNNIEKNKNLYKKGQEQIIRRTKWLSF